MLEYLLFKNSNVLKLQLKELCKIAHYYVLHAHSLNGRQHSLLFYMYFSWSPYCVPKVIEKNWSSEPRNTSFWDPKMPPSPPPFWSSPKLWLPYISPKNLRMGMNENFEYRPKNLHWELMNWNEWTKVKEGTSIISTV